MVFESDIVICTLLQKRDIRGLEKLYDLYYKSLVLWADTFLHNVSHSEDLVQDFFIKLWERELYKTFPPESMRAYLFTAVKNQALNRIALRDPLKRTYDVTRLERPWEDYDDIRETLFRRVEKSIQHLPPRSRLIVEAVYLEGKSYKEVSEKFGISIHTVKTMLVRSLKQIRDESNVSRSTILLFFFKKISILCQPFSGLICRSGVNDLKDDRRCRHRFEVTRLFKRRDKGFGMRRGRKLD